MDKVTLTLCSMPLQFGTSQDGKNIFFDPSATNAVRRLGNVGQTIEAMVDLCPNPREECRDRTPYAVIGRESVHGLAKDHQERTAPEPIAETKPVSEQATTAMAGALGAAGLIASQTTASEQELTSLLGREAVAKLIGGEVAGFARPLIAAVAISDQERETLQVMVGARFPRAIFDEKEAVAAKMNLERVLLAVQKRRLEAAKLFFAELAEFCETNEALHLGALSGELPELDERGNPVFPGELSELLAKSGVESELEPEMAEETEDEPEADGGLHHIAEAAEPKSGNGTEG